jgi:hypothetical protein
LVQGDPVDAILAASRGADLVVLGPRRGDRSAPSVELRVLSRVRVPLIVFRPFDTPGEVELPRPVLVGVVGEPSDDLVAFAFAEAALRGTALHALFVDVDGVPSERPQPDALTTWSEKYPEVVVSRSIRRGVDAAVALAAASRSAHLVVVGAGAEAIGLVHLAGCPVAVVPISSQD